MPSETPKQARFMAGVAHSKAFAQKVGVPQSVGREFNQADAGTGILKRDAGGATNKLDDSQLWGGLKSYIPDWQPDWLRTLQHYFGVGLDAMNKKPEVALASQFITRVGPRGIPMVSPTAQRARALGAAKEEFHSAGPTTSQANWNEYNARPEPPGYREQMDALQDAARANIKAWNKKTKIPTPEQAAEYERIQNQIGALSDQTRGRPYDRAVQQQVTLQNFPELMDELKPLKPNAAGGPVRAAGGRVEAAAAQTERNPTDAQKKSGNYAKGKVRLHGLEIAIENPKGGERSGTDKGGKPWSVTMPAHYGYVKGTEGKDGDHVDVYIGPKPDSQTVFVVDQVDASSGKFDEHKCMLGYSGKDAALADYKKAFSDGKGGERIGGVTQMSMSEFKDWLKHGNTKKAMTKKIDGGLNAARAYATGGSVRGYETGGSPFGGRGGLSADYEAVEPMEGTRLIDAPVEHAEPDWRPGLSRIPHTDQNGNRVFAPEAERGSGPQMIDRLTGRAWPEFDLGKAAYEVPMGMMMTSGLSGNAAGFTKSALGHAAEMYGQYAPKAVAGLLGLGSALTTGTPAGSAEAEAPGGANLDATRARIKALEEEAAGFKKEMDEWQARRQKMMPDKRAPSSAILESGPRAGQRMDEGYFQADENYKKAKESYDLLKGKEGTIAKLQETLDPEYQRQQREADQLKKQQLEQQAANRSFKEKYPDWAANWYLLPPAIAAGTAAVITGGKKWQDYRANAPWHEAVDAAKRGLTLGGEDALSLVPTLKSLAQYNKGYETEAKAAKAAAKEAANRGWVRKGLSAINPGMAGGIGAALGVETGLLPWQHDLATLGYEKTKDHMTPMDMFMKLGVSPVMSLLTGKGIGAVTKYLTPTSRPPYEDSKGLAGFLNANATAKEIATLRRNLGLTGADLPRITASPADEIATQDILKASQGRTGAGQAGQAALEQVPPRLLAAPIPERPLGGAPRESIPNQGQTQTSDAPLIPELAPLPGKASEVNAAVKAAAKRRAAERKLIDQDEANRAAEAERKSAAARRKAEKKWGNLPEESQGGSVTGDPDKHHSYFQPRDKRTGRYAGGPVYPQHREDTDGRQGHWPGGVTVDDRVREYADRGNGSITNPYFPPDYGNDRATNDLVFKGKTATRKEGGRTNREPSQTPGEPTAVREEYPYGKPRFPNLDPRAYLDADTFGRYAYGSPAAESFGAVLPTLAGLGAILTGRPGPASEAGGLLGARDQAMALAHGNPRIGRSITGGRPERYRNWQYNGPEADYSSAGMVGTGKIGTAADKGLATRIRDDGTALPAAEMPTARPANDYATPEGWSVIPGGMRANGGMVRGGIVGHDGGRDDTRPISVASGSFVIPAETVSNLGGGNTLHGIRVLDNVFKHQGSPQRAAAGGSTGSAVPIRISDGEYVLTPDQVAAVGGGDVERGHRLLDQMVMQLRKQHIKTLSSLPAPAKD